jgi:predicted site-specific integrase-resolvase
MAQHLYNPFRQSQHLFFFPLVEILREASSAFRFLSSFWIKSTSDQCNKRSQEMISNIDKCVHLFYTSPMKLSQFAKQQGISCRPTLRWFRVGAMKGYRAPSGTIIVDSNAPVVAPQKVAIYARVSSAEHRANLERQGERFSHYCEVNGYQVAQVVKEDLIADLVAIVSSFTARLYRQRRASGRWLPAMGRHHDATGGAAYHQQERSVL